MKMQTWLFLVFIIFSACSSNKTEALETFSTCELQVGEDVLCGPDGLKLRLTRIVADSRCPVDVVCVWAGLVEVAINVDGTSVRLALDPGNPEDNTATVGNHTIRLLTVDPQPLAGQVIDPDDYRVGVVIE